MSSTLEELAPERVAARSAIEAIRFTPVLFELGARPHPPRALYRAYLEQSDVFVGIYWRRYGWIAPGTDVSGLEDEYLLAGPLPKLVYVKEADGEREPALAALLERVASDDVSYRRFGTPKELGELLADDLAMLVSERFAQPVGTGAGRLVSIPAPVSSFVGRENEVEAVTALLRREDVRLVTLTGPGGIGKTRLAMEAGRRLAPEVSEEIAFVSLAEVADPDAVTSAISQAIDVSLDELASPVDALAAHFAGRELLLLLDNFEHLLPAARQVAALLSAAPGLRVLATSRSRLGITGEHLYAVPPMSLPGPDERGAAGIERSDAVRLFAARAQAAGWTTTEADAPIVADIVCRLDGLPLAIELAAAQARLVPAELVHARLRRRLDLGGGPRDADERHRTLRSTIAWSYDLLDEPARRFFEELAVFVGGFSLDAVAAVAGSGGDVEELLASLVDSSLVTTGPSATWGVRFGMLDTIGEYAGEQLEASGTRASTAARHLAYYAELADEAYEASPFDATGRARLDDERENLQAAYREAMSTDPEQAVRLAGALGSFFTRRGLSREGRQAIARALEAAPNAATSWRARALLQLAWLAAEFDDHAEADRRANEALELYRELGDERGIGASLNTLGFSASTREDGDRARRFYEEAYETFADAPQGTLRHYAGVNLAAILASSGQLDEARRLYREALDFFEPRGLEEEVATIQYRLGELEQAEGDLEAARRQLGASVEVARRVGNQHLLSWALTRLGDVDALAGRPGQAVDELSEALEVHLELGVPLGAAHCLDYAAHAACRERRWAAAARLLGAARVRREAANVPVSPLERPRVAATEAELRERLGLDRFEAEAAAGARLSASELLALVEGAAAPLEGAS